MLLVSSNMVDHYFGTRPPLIPSQEALVFICTPIFCGRGQPQLWTWCTGRLVMWKWNRKPSTYMLFRCHSFLLDGQVKFCQSKNVIWHTSQADLEKKKNMDPWTATFYAYKVATKNLRYIVWPCFKQASQKLVTLIKIFLIKFRYNAHSYCLKKCALWGYKTWS